MGVTIKHYFQSAKADGADPTQIQPSNWNDAHALLGGTAGDALTRDPTDPYGNAWSPHGQWLTVPFNAANFGGLSGMTVTVEAGDQASFAYTLIGRTMTIAWFLSGFSVGGTLGSAITIVIPGGKICERYAFNSCNGSDNGVLITAYTQATPDSSILYVIKSDQTAWRASTNNSGLYGQITLGVKP